MKLKKSYILGGFVLFLWCLFMGVTAISIGVGSLFPQLNYIASPFVCPGGTMSVEQKVYTVSPVETVTSIIWYCTDGRTGAKNEMDPVPMNIASGLIGGTRLFLAILAAIPLAQRWPRAVGYSLVALVVVGVTAFNLSGIFGALFNNSQATHASPTPVDFAHVALSFGGQGTAPGLFQSARHIAVDPDGSIYVDDLDNLRVQKFDPAGKYVSSWDVDENLCPYTRPDSLGTLSADGDGNVFVLYCLSILKYDGAAGKLLAQFNSEKNPPRDIYLYRNEILYPDGGLLVLAEAPAAHEVLFHLDTSGKVLARYPNLVTAQSKSPASAGTLDPAMDSLGNIFLLNPNDSAIYKFTPDGRYVSKFGSAGTGVGQFDGMAEHIAIDNQSRVYVTDSSGIKVFDSNGAYIESMSDRFIRDGGIYEMRINDKNEIYLVTSSNMIYKLVRNAK